MTLATSNVKKTLPHPQQQPNKPQTATQHQKQTHNKPQKKVHTQKTHNNQTKKRTQNQLPAYSLLHFLQIQQVFLLSDNKHFQTAPICYKKILVLFVVLFCFAFAEPKFSC
jgi:hypothetical protein